MVNLPRFEKAEASLCALFLNVLFERFQRCAAHSRGVVRRLPEMPAPQSVFNRGELFENIACRASLESLNYVADLVSRFEPNDNVNMVNVSLNTNYSRSDFGSDFVDYFFHSIAYLVSQYRATILDYPYQMHRKGMFIVCATLRF